jgi:UDP-glucose 4-epimerase
MTGSKGRMELKGKKLLVIGGGGLIGSHTVDRLIKEDVKEIVIYDNFVRGCLGNLSEALKDRRVKIHEAGGDILQTDILGCYSVMITRAVLLM